MGMGQILCLALLLPFRIFGIRCGKTSDSADHPTIKPTQESILFSHSKNPDIRGTDVGVSQTEGIIIALHVEGIWDADIKYDQASVGINEKLVSTCRQTTVMKLQLLTNYLSVKRLRFYL